MFQIKMFLLVILIMQSVIMDLRSYKIKNGLCLSFAMFGMICNAFPIGSQNVFMYLIGLLAPFLVLLPFYALNMLGAGDIKLFCAIGAFVGADRIFQCIAYSFLLGFIIAIIIMIQRKNLVERFKKLYSYFKYCLLNMTVAPYEKANAYSEGRMHFTIPIALGTLAAYLL